MKAYLQTPDEVLKQEGSSFDGLSQTSALERLEKNGENALEKAKKKSLFTRVLEQIKDPMILILIAAGVVSGVFGEVPDMIIILIVVALNTVLGIFQESKAEKAIEALQNMSAPHSKVRRGGKALVIESKDLVLGDIVLLEAGDSVPADLRLLQTASLKIEEAALTGESNPVQKTSDALEDTGIEVPLGDRKNMAYMGTNVVYGRGEGVVTQTGMQTEMGKIAGILSSTKEDKTPLQQKLASLSKVLSIAVIGICLFIFLFGVLTSGGFSSGHVFEFFLTAVSLAVAAIPEGLVVVVTVLLSLGVTKMSRKNAIIRRLTAVETLGSTDIICSDKTGTLTQNKMTVTQSYGDTASLSMAMYLCNDAQTGASAVGDPTEIALKEFAEKNIGEIQNPRVGEAPFDSVRKMMSTLHKEEGIVIQYTKGAPDVVLAACDTVEKDGQILPLTREMRDQILLENKRMADKALRVLAAARKTYPSLPQSLEPNDLEQGMTFLGLCGMIDPVRPEVKAAIEECRQAGIRPIMITGDHRDTAVAIAKELHIIDNENQAITGSELAQMSDQEFEQKIEHISVYARVQPEHKVRIVEAWRKKGKITAMTGDGVNDAPALKTADIGVGMGITGTDVTKDVADMVLSDDNFATIVYAVEEGRRIYENIRKAIQFLLASNLSEVVSIFIATLFGFKLFAPIQILWINLITDTFPAMALGMEEAEADAMQKPPRDPKETVFAGGLGIGVIYQGVLIAALTLTAFLIGHAHSPQTGMTMAFYTLSMCEIMHSLNMRSRDKSLFSLKGHNKYLLGAMALSFVLTIAVMYIPGLNALFQLTALPINLLLLSMLLAFLIVPIVEIVKFIQRKAAGR